MRAKDPLDRTLALLHEATLEDALWIDAARQLNETCRTRGCALGLLAGTYPTDVEILFRRCSLNGQRREDHENRYFEEHYLRDPGIPRVIQRPPGQVLYASDLYTEREKKESAVYNVMLRELEAQDGLHICQTGPGGSQVSWVLFDSLEGSWTSAQISLIEHLRPHVRRYVSMRQRLASARALGKSLIGLLDNASVGVIQLDAHGGIVAANDRALDILTKGDGLGDDGGHLRARLPAESAKLSALLTKAVPPFGAQGHAGSMAITRALARTPLILDVNPVEGRRPWVRGRVAALVLITDPVHRIDAVAAEAAPDSRLV
ncbi:PAS domain-containing protein [Candidatus Palauibacter sp.]|uniref:PAS domain-containing protein n=1 Tax=Candidatus Palauibacter sp. TaxID=3101350 RepID=UPI003B01DA4A